MKAARIYLIGFSGTGKSTVAQLVAAQLGWLAYDLDQIIAERRGMSITEIFAREGEASFRDYETAALHELDTERAAVIATGGGLPLRPENRSFMQATGWVICLEGRPELIHTRLQQQRDEPDAIRPLLETEDPLEKVRRLKAQRQPIYALADWTIHTDRLNPFQVAAEVVRAYGILEETQCG
ncbi:shikimate kinase [Oscillochloris trichoides DG-6]|uniref:Shikimate kinase n=1 Tax=Oscillochloris trichoides DG-6 TaxID=765420 RepID=E1ID25_9CHLR|nr:shikimate kinase [Oscillochloris trichoides]EFO80896.1 shikimate kinase [Oscillochloris trichoides DG-6]